MTSFAQLAALLVLAITVTPGDALDCFLCSYSPRGNSSREDTCTDEKFVEEETEVKSCNLGCESVTIRDVNGAMESFHRNCATKSIIITNSCETYKSLLLTRVVCSCDSSYCNSASRRGLTSSGTVIMALGAIVMSWLYPREILLRI